MYKEMQKCLRYADGGIYKVWGNPEDKNALLYLERWVQLSLKPEVFHILVRVNCKDYFPGGIF